MIQEPQQPLASGVGLGALPQTEAQPPTSQPPNAEPGQLHRGSRSLAGMAGQQPRGGLGPHPRDPKGTAGDQSRSSSRCRYVTVGLDSIPE